ncbi:hypothetical protein B484DRAFT_397430 [Ochromonadaceae sp. CCMP2298]|nr:hypothetical protein B484DRAFT_397430 [Ochromonadaceae sp. CCMP2298]
MVTRRDGLVIVSFGVIFLCLALLYGPATAGYFAVTVLIVLGWPLALLLLRYILKRTGRLDWLEVLGKEARQACRRREDLLRGRLKKQKERKLSSRVVSAARRTKGRALSAVKKSKDFVSEKSAKLGEVLSVAFSTTLACDLCHPLDPSVVGTKTEGEEMEAEGTEGEEGEDGEEVKEGKEKGKEEGEGEDNCTELMQIGIRDNHVFWGMRDYLLPGGLLSVPVLHILVHIPPGLFEDAVFHLCNSIDPVSLVLSHGS